MPNIETVWMIVILVIVFIIGIFAGIWIWDDIISWKKMRLCKERDL